MTEKKVQKRVPGYKSENQKYKSLLVMQYILKNADDEHAVTVGQIEDYSGNQNPNKSCKNTPDLHRSEIPNRSGVFIGSKNAIHSFQR